MTVECNSPWVTQVIIEPGICYLNDEGEYYKEDDTVPDGSEYDICIGFDGMPVYSEATVVEYDAAMGGNSLRMSYPMKKGVTKQFKVGFLVDSKYNDSLFIKLPVASLMKYGDSYKYCIKATN